MAAVVEAIFPIFAIIVIGGCLRRIAIFPAAAWPPVERLSYYLLFPSLLFVSLARADVQGLSPELMAIGVVGPPFLMTLALLVFRPWLTIAGPGFTSLLQGAVRFNTYIGLPLVIAFHEHAALAPAALFIAFMVPSINVVCVWILTRYGDGAVSGLSLLGELCRNPLIISCVLGIMVNVSGLQLPAPLGKVVELLGHAAPTVGLLCVGAGLDLVAVRSGWQWVAGACVLKLGLMPLVALGVGTTLGLSGPELWVLVVFHALPSAPAAYILARQLGGDSRLMAGILTAQTAVAVVTLPLWISLLAG